MLQEHSHGNCYVEIMSLSSTCSAFQIQFIPNSQDNVTVCHTLKGNKKKHKNCTSKHKKLLTNLKEMNKQFNMKMSQTY